MQLAGKYQGCSAEDATGELLPTGFGTAAHLPHAGGGWPKRHGLGVQLKRGAHPGKGTFLGWRYSNIDDFNCIEDEKVSGCHGRTTVSSMRLGGRVENAVSSRKQVYSQPQKAAAVLASSRKCR